MDFFKRHIRPALVGVIVMLIPIVVITVIANLPPSDPPIPDYYKAQGLSAVDGSKLEKYIATATQLDSQNYAVACPDVTVVSTTQPGLCGYCKISDMVIYPFWQEGFTAKLRPERYDYRSIYIDQIHRRYISLTHGDYRLFTKSEQQGFWNPSYGKWFYCKTSGYLDLNAYVKVYRDWSASNALHVRLDVGTYETLTPVLDQIQVKKPSPKPSASNGN